MKEVCWLVLLCVCVGFIGCVAIQEPPTGREPPSVGQEPTQNTPDASPDQKTKETPERKSLPEQLVTPEQPPVSCPTSCVQGEYCFQGSLCLPKEAVCDKATPCQQGQLCIAGRCKETCVLSERNKFLETNHPSCMNGKGACFFNPYYNTKAFCIPPVKETRKEAARCLNFAKPESDEINACAPGLGCVPFNPPSGIAYCQRECHSGGSCGTGKTCRSVLGCSVWPFCKSTTCTPNQRQLTRRLGESCKQDINPYAAEYNDCKEGRCFNGICRRKQSNTRRLNQTCDLSDHTAPGYDACAKGLLCYDFRCHQGCNPKDATNTCQVNQVCQPFSTGGVCRTQCDPNKPKLSKGNCPEGQYCYIRRNQAPLCRPLPIYYTNKGEVCGNGSCQKACNPLAASSGCPRGTTCVENVQRSSLGGICLPPGIQTEGQSCDQSHRRCVKGLRCGSEGRCEPECDPRTHLPTAHPSCPKGSYCRGLAIHNPFNDEYGTCRTLPNKEQGTLTRKERCSSTKQCDGAKGFACIEESPRIGPRCEKMCEPGNTGSCEPWETCSLSERSALGGYCEMKACYTKQDGTSDCPSGAICKSFSFHSFCVVK